ncbi:cation-translocating P-type ATPase [candidate division KSB1 bacterium]|nr:cation-translocating P-type ATPase [candidate division KSB1 bacterium]
MKDWYQLKTGEVLQELETNLEQGLAPVEIESRLKKYGFNELVERGLKSPWRILFEQFTATMVVILIIAAIVSGFLGDLNDTVAIFAIVLINAMLGFRQEYRAERAMAALKKLAVPHMRVRRGGHIQELSARELVPGDIIFLEAGNLVPADCRLIETAELRIQEAALTGESEAVEKHARVITEINLPIGDRRNLAYMGTVVTFGRGVGVVTRTGMQTELGSIANLIQAVAHEPTPLQKRLSHLGRVLVALSLGLVSIVFVLGLLRGEALKDMFLTAVSMAVAAVPEGLPAVVTIALALGAQRMLKRRALIRKLAAVETLGSVTVICSDKTGTLTENRMTVVVMDVANHQVNFTEDIRKSGIIAQFDAANLKQLQQQSALSLMTVSGSLCNDALLEVAPDRPDQVNIVGDPTEGALLLVAAKAGVTKSTLEKSLPRIAEAPFDSDRKRMTTVHQVPDTKSKIPSPLENAWLWNHGETPPKYLAFTKGAVDSLLEISSHVWIENQLLPLTGDLQNRILEANANLAQNGMRVLGIGFRTFKALPAEINVASLEQDLVFIGMFGMIDPARAEVKDAVQTCINAGIRPVMITGDHPLTAQYIAKELGIYANDQCLTGKDLENLSLDELEQVVEKVSVYARVSPEHKLKIVQALQHRGHIVAMTGDGVNDAPALKKADIGVAMGITGTDVTKEASDMVLQDDNFATIVAAVEEGRTIYDNIRKFIKYILTGNLGELLVMLIAPFFGMPLPLLPLQILWINLVTDGLPGLALSLEPPEPRTMRRPPYPPKQNIFARGMGRDIIWLGMLTGLFSLLPGVWYYQINLPNWQTMVFTTLTLAQMANVMAIRSEREFLFRVGIRSNKALLGAVLLTIGLQLAVVYVPFLQKFFDTKSLSIKDLGICLAAAGLIFVAAELEKWIYLLRTRKS